ncbi:ferredoxin [Mycolicibacterium sp. CBM1]
MRIRLDRTLCDGFGTCAKHAPKYFSLDDWGYAALVGDGVVPDADRGDVLRALFDCPVHAIVEISPDEFNGESPAKVPTTDEEPAFEARWGFAQ